MDNFNLVQMLNRQKHLQNKLFYSGVRKLLLLLIFKICVKVALIAVLEENAK